MIQKEEIGSSNNTLSFIVPQVGRVITLRFVKLTSLADDSYKLAKPLLHEKFSVYQVGNDVAEIHAETDVAILYDTLEDAAAVMKYVYLFDYKGGYYGYTILSKDVCDSFLQAHHAEPLQTEFVTVANKQVFKVDNQYYLVTYPNSSKDKYGYVFGSYEDMKLEDELVKDFISKYK